MAGLNRVVLVGRMVRDPELKRTNSGTSVTSFTIAVDNLTKAGSERSASFIPCTSWTIPAGVPFTPQDNTLISSPSEVETSLKRSNKVLFSEVI